MLITIHYILQVSLSNDETLSSTIDQSYDSTLTMSLGLFLCHMMDGLIDVVIDLEGGTLPCDNLIFIYMNNHTILHD